MQEDFSFQQYLCLLNIKGFSIVMQQDDLASICSYLRPVLNQYSVQFSHLITVAIPCDCLAWWQQFNNRARLRLLKLSLCTSSKSLLLPFKLTRVECSILAISLINNFFDFCSFFLLNKNRMYFIWNVFYFYFQTYLETLLQWYIMFVIYHVRCRSQHLKNKKYSFHIIITPIQSFICDPENLCYSLITSY